MNCIRQNRDVLTVPPGVLNEGRPQRSCGDKNCNPAEPLFGSAAQCCGDEEGQGDIERDEPSPRKLDELKLWQVLPKEKTRREHQERGSTSERQKHPPELKKISPVAGRENCGDCGYKNRAESYRRNLPVEQNEFGV